MRNLDEMQNHYIWKCLTMGFYVTSTIVQPGVRSRDFQKP